VSALRQQVRPSKQYVLLETLNNLLESKSSHVIFHHLIDCRPVLAALECLWKSISLVLIHPFFQILLSCP
jgi:hypothetical protein